MNNLAIIFIISILAFGIWGLKGEQLLFKQIETDDSFVEIQDAYIVENNLKEGPEIQRNTGIIGYVIERDGDKVLIVDSQNQDNSVWISSAPEEIEIGQEVKVKYDGVVFFTNPAQAVEDIMNFEKGYYNEFQHVDPLDEPNETLKVIENVISNKKYMGDNFIYK
ncbi:hypothetical protein Q9251_04445 [Alkalihalobacillus macyae]|uniref:hypothetical protein n=1 Tax=Guptibacillus hwajinpoensis TaxID=208199 RepID=UPI00273C3BCE|nr:hypothetical protein [Alkalihalobacillus macyae]MDP4550129.1 hypothetical protein [Alkalihalobacillus macyae]